MEMLANTSVVIILQDINVEINTWYALNLHSVICQLYLNFLKKQKLFKFKLKNEILIHATIWMNLDNVMLSEISQTQKKNIK